MVASCLPAQPAPRVMVWAGMTAGQAELFPSRGGSVVSAAAV
ncbi:MAG: hypothetical protein ACRDRI_00495 [Pseudonocardiaceae bacterium]